jgi:hypothetical protein
MTRDYVGRQTKNHIALSESHHIILPSRICCFALAIELLSACGTRSYQRKVDEHKKFPTQERCKRKSRSELKFTERLFMRTQKTITTMPTEIFQLLKKIKSRQYF